MKVHTCVYRLDTHELAYVVVATSTLGLLGRGRGRLERALGDAYLPRLGSVSPAPDAAAWRTGPRRRCSGGGSGSVRDPSRGRAQGRGARAPLASRADEAVARGAGPGPLAERVGAAVAGPGGPGGEQEGEEGEGARSGSGLCGGLVPAVGAAGAAGARRGRPAGPAAPATALAPATVLSVSPFREG